MRYQSLPVHLSHLPPIPPHLPLSFTYLETGLRHGSQQGLVPVKLPCVLLVEGLGGREEQEAACRQEEGEAGPEEEGEAHDDVNDAWCL